MPFIHSYSREPQTTASMGVRRRQKRKKYFTIPTKVVSPALLTALRPAAGTPLAHQQHAQGLNSQWGTVWGGNSISRQAQGRSVRELTDQGGSSVFVPPGCISCLCERQCVWFCGHLHVRAGHLIDHFHLPHQIHPGDILVEIDGNDVSNTTLSNLVSWQTRATPLKTSTLPHLALADTPSCSAVYLCCGCNVFLSNAVVLTRFL